MVQPCGPAVTAVTVQLWSSRHGPAVRRQADAAWRLVGRVQQQAGDFGRRGLVAVESAWLPSRSPRVGSANPLGWVTYWFIHPAAMLLHSPCSNIIGSFTVGSFIEGWLGELTNITAGPVPRHVTLLQRERALPRVRRRGDEAVHVHSAHALHAQINRPVQQRRFVRVPHCPFLVGTVNWPASTLLFPFCKAREREILYIRRVETGSREQVRREVVSRSSRQ